MPARLERDHAAETSVPSIMPTWQGGGMQGQHAKLVAELGDAAGDGLFSGVVVVVDVGGEPLVEIATGFANRADERPVLLDTRLATASATKGFTALTVAAMIDDGLFGYNTRLAELVGDDLPHVAGDVTIEHLLGHTSGVGDYIDEEQVSDIDDHVVDVSSHELTGPEAYVPILNRHHQTDPPGTRFAYNNSGYVMLALAIERVADGSYHDEVRRRVFEPAGMTSTDFHRSDRLPGNTALGYLADGRTNVFNLPVIGTGDGGAYTTAHDMLRFWNALLAGKIIERSLVDVMTSSRQQHTSGEQYGLGFWITSDGSTVFLQGMDAGVSLYSGFHLATGVTFCVIANNSTDAWPMAKIIDRHLAG